MIWPSLSACIVFTYFKKAYCRNSSYIKMILRIYPGQNYTKTLVIDTNHRLCYSMHLCSASRIMKFIFNNFQWIPSESNLYFIDFVFDFLLNFRFDAIFASFPDFPRIAFSLCGHLYRSKMIRASGLTSTCHQYKNFANVAWNIIHILSLCHFNIFVIRTVKYYFLSF